MVNSRQHHGVDVAEQLGEGFGPADEVLVAELLGNVDTVVLPGVDHFSLPKQFAFIDAALEFLDAVPKW